jgi:hypothetical protein
VDDDHAGTFDHRSGRVVHVDALRETWVFDVCANTWHYTDASGVPVDESLVYDIDSDVTIALGPGDFSVYDARTNEWTRPAIEVVGGPAPDSFWGVAYDPISGLVITTADNRIWAFDVETNRMTSMGFVPIGGQLAGYVKDLDRLLFVADSQTVLVDPRTGEMTMPAAGDVPQSEWSYDFFDANGTVFIGAETAGPGEGCGFNPETLAWDLCFERTSPLVETFSSLVEDRINDRLVLINSDTSVDDVWVVDLDAGAMTELLAPSE